MLDNLTTRLARVMKTLKGEARLTESNIADAVSRVNSLLSTISDLDKQIVATSLPETGSQYFDPSLPDVAAGETVTPQGHLARVMTGFDDIRIVLAGAAPIGMVKLERSKAQWKLVQML